MECFAKRLAVCIIEVPRHSKIQEQRMERRLHTRHRARTTVYVIMSGRKSRICKAKNLSANGVFVETENLGLRKGQQVQLAFAINLGLITKIHRRTAIVAHVTRGGTGLMMEQFAAR
jgi:PilZ domain